MRISLIAAVADNGVIGCRGELPWHLASDLRRFRELTMNHHLLVGRKTFESIGRALPGRRMVVISRAQPRLPAGVVAADGLDAALRLAELTGDDEVFVAGGAEIYALALPRADRLYLTRVHASPEGDAFFPAIDFGEWRPTEREEGTVDERSPLPHTFLVYDRAPAGPPSL